MRDGSGEIDFRKLVEDTDRHGNVRVYLRVKGQPKIRLREIPGTDAFLTEYRRALAGKTKPKTPKPDTHYKPSTKGSISWLVKQYYTCAEFKGLGDRTQQVRRLILDAFCRKDGDKPYAKLEPKHIRKRRDAKSDTPEAANGMIKALRQVFTFAVDNDHHDRNPAKDVPYLKSTGDGFHSWSIEEVEQFEKRHPIGTKAHLAMALLLYSAQRRSDIVGFGPHSVKAGKLTFTQVKNARNKPITLELPVRPELKAVLEASQLGEATFIVTEFNKPYTSNGFGNWFRRRCDEAGLPHCSSHGLRKAAATRLAEADASESEIMAITGHTTSKEVSRYTKAKRQKVLAEQAFDRFKKPPESEKSVPPSED
ncbi:integrase [Phyllobacterium zundukense]|uniref:Integrase n=2 Tax=Phyllobacterium zundukense TaxID=1867719 RepID=A0A2N9VS65_9HYPH|nr:integrase [Phyllobacterium zundukense]PIO42333.1 integrase [Phyllobacterium zundukense]